MATLLGVVQPSRLLAEPVVTVQPFLEQHCVRCHGEKKQKGNFRLDTAPREVSAAGFERSWGMALERITSGEMPPEDEKQPTPEERTRVVELVSAQIKEAEAHRFATTDRVSLHKLTRDEYANTLHDLLGVTYVPGDPGNLPEDPNWHGFERIGSVLTLSPAHVERHLAAAEAALDQALPTSEPMKPVLLRWMGPHEVLSPDMKKPPAERWGYPSGAWRSLLPPNVALKGSVQGSDFNLNIKQAGDYVVRIKASGLRPPGGSAPHLRLYSLSLNRVLGEADLEAPETQPKTIEFRTHLDVGSHVIQLYHTGPGLSPYAQGSGSGSYRTPFQSLAKGHLPNKQKLTDDEGVPLFPILIVDYLEWEGPFIESRAEQLLGTGDRDAAHARRSIAAFAERAFRRPVPAEESDRLSAVAVRDLAKGLSFEKAVKNALLAVLCSKDFLYLVEGSAETARGRLNDWELASRLSYFLGSTMPDQRLFDLARAGNFHETDTLRAEVARLLNGPSSARFSEGFPREWLQLRNVGKFPPDKKLYPDYDEQIEEGMVSETTAFFQRVLADNLSLREFITSDWTVLNGPLARHYGIPGVVDAAMQKVSLKPEYHRGGLLTQAAILSLTSDGTRHRPVHRGKWVLESIFGKTPPPPPPNAGNIPTTPATQPKATLRMKLEAHRSNEACAGCHARMDPFGLAFDNYDAIGRWRSVETVRDGAGENPPVDPSGVLPDGRKFADAEGLKQLLAADVDKFAAAFTEKLATYALRRAMSYGDREALLAITRQTKSNGYRLRDLVEALVSSDLFQKR